jgi:hypothetical protein
MLSKKEYNDILDQLYETPSTISTTERKNLRKRLKQHEYSIKLAPFEPLPHIPKFINRTTTEQTLRHIIQAAIMFSEFTIDTKSFSVFRETNKPALIQLQIFLPHDSSFILLIEVCHLPRNDHICFKLIQELFRIILTPAKKIFIFGSNEELYPFTKFKLFSRDQINTANIINLQEKFKIFWNQQHPSRSTCSRSLTTFTKCICEICIGKRPSELWSFQDCVAYLLNEYLSKTLENENFQIGLDPELFEVNPNEQHHRYLLSTYAKNDCLSMQRLIIQMKKNHFDFDSISPAKISQKSSRFILPKFDDELEIISSDDDYPSERQSSNRISSIKKTTDRSVVILKNNYTLSSINEDSLMTHPQEEQILPLKRFPSDWESISSDGDRGNLIDNEEPLTTHHGRLSIKDRRKIHNHSCNIKRRQRYYKDKIIIKNIYQRFTIPQIKNVLREKNIRFYAVSIFTSRTNNERTLFIGIRDSSQIHHYYDQIRHFFTKENFDEINRTQPRQDRYQYRQHYDQQKQPRSNYSHHHRHHKH